MKEDELKEFLKMVTPMLKELPEDEIKKQLLSIDISENEREELLTVILLLKEED